MAVVGKSALFGLSTIALAAGSLVTVPALIQGIGPLAWASLATGMAVGAIAATAVSWGWGVTGPGQIALETHGGKQAQIYFDSLAPRFYLVLPATIVSAVIAFLVVPTAQFSAALVAASVAIYGLGSAWYFAGASRPVGLLWCDTLPRVTANILGAIVVLLTNDPLYFALIQIGGTFVVLIATHIGILRGTVDVRTHSVPRRVVIGRLHTQGSAVSTAAVAASYLALPLVIVAAVLPAATPVFALGDRILKWTITAMTPAVQVLQGWVPANGRLRDRAGRGLLVAAALGAVLGASILGLGGTLASVLSDDEIVLSLSASAAVGATVLATAISRVSGSAILAPLGLVRWMLTSALIGAAVGLLGLFPLLYLYGASGALWSVAIAEMVVTLVQLIAVANAMKGRKET